MTVSIPQQQPVAPIMEDALKSLQQSLAQALELAVTHHQSGQFDDAESLYRTILEAQPNHPDANHNLGVLAVQAKQAGAGLPYFAAALEAKPEQQQYWLSYIDALIQADEAETAKQMLELGRQHGLQGDDVEALAARLEGRVQAVQYIDAAPQAAQPQSNTEPVPKAIQREKPVWQAAPHNGGGKIPAVKKIQALINLYSKGRLAEAEVLARSFTTRFPKYGAGWKMLGVVLQQQGRPGEALVPSQKAAELLPGDAEAHSNLSAPLQDQGRLAEAEVSLRRALKIEPDYAKGHNNLGNVLKDLGRLAEAEASYRQALKILPDFGTAHSNLGNILKDLGRLAEAELSYRQALTIHPDFAEAHSNLLFSMNFSADHAPSYYLDDARQYGRMVDKEAGQKFSSWQCASRPDRLRVGLVSGDLHNHSVGFFLENLLAHLDPKRIELIAYPTHHKTDAVTARIKPYFAAWKPLLGYSDAAAARLIHADGVHVLLDLSGHTGHNRLPVFGWKPAPVQVSWLGYFATTGVAQMDYLLGDPYVTPAEEQGHFTECVWRLPESYLCFTPPDVSVEAGPLPALSSGSITFGCFNNLAKMNDAVVTLWARVLQAVPGSRLFLKTKQLNDPVACEATRRRFAERGIAADRLVLEGESPRSELLAAYRRVDIALDPFPYPGGTTSVEALWMCVPVITRQGDRFLSHVGESIAHNAGQTDWVAADDDDYVAKAVAHAGNLESLARLRSGLRQQVLASPVFDARRFSGNFEAALWSMWQNWRIQQGIST